MNRNKKDKKFIDKNRALIEECRKGSTKAQFKIYKLYYHSMFNTCFRIVNDTMEAEDIMQESFLKAFESLYQYKGEVSFGAWLKKIVVNKAIDALRKKNRLPEEPLESHINLKEEYIDTDEEEPEEGVDLQRIKQEIGMLPEGYRIILSLYLLEGYDHDEISEILGISGSTSRSQYSRARKKLLLNLKKKNYETGRSDK